MPIKPATTKRKPPALKPAKEEELSETEQKAGIKARNTKPDKGTKTTGDDSKPKRKTAASKKVVEDSESEDDLFLNDSPPPKKAFNRKGTAKVKAESNDEIIIDDAKTRVQNKGKEKRKRCVSLGSEANY